MELDLKPESPAINLDFRKHREGLCRGQIAGVIRVGFGLLAPRAVLGTTVGI